MTEITESWYSNLIEELTAIVDGVVESRFNYSWDLIDCYHQIGTRLLQENDSFERSKIYGEKISQRVAKSIGRSYSTVRYAVKFAKLFPDLSLFPEGKNIHWRHIINKYLTDGTEKKKIKKADLYRMIKEFRELLEIEWYKYHQERINPQEYTSIVVLENIMGFIRYLQDQVNKITGELGEKC